MRTESRRGGFALVLSLVVMTLLFVAASSLYLSRQMWATTSRKQLDHTIIETVTRADAQVWVAQFRDQLQSGGALDLAASPVQVTDPVQPEVAGVSNLFTPKVPYPQYPADAAQLAIPWLFDTSVTPTPGTVMRSEPYWGTRSIMGYSGALFRREMDPATHAQRIDVSNTSSQMRAWNSLDGALPARISFRALPVSIFTLWVGAPAEGVSDALTFGSWLSAGSFPYNYGGYAVSDVGIGRVYLEGTALIPLTLTVGLPLVATNGITLSGGAELALQFPTTSGGGSLSASWSDSTDFFKKRNSWFRGMLVTSLDASSRLLRQGVTKGSDGFWRALPLTNSGGMGSFVGNVIAARGVDVDKLELSTFYDPTRFSTSDFGALENSGWTLNAAAKELVFSPPAGWFDGFSTPPYSLTVFFWGTGASDWKLRILVPSIAALSTSPAKQKLSVVCTSNPIIIEGNFNSTGDGVGMVAASDVFISSLTPVTIRGLILTEAASPDAPFYFYGVGTAPAVDLWGSLVIWRRLAAPNFSGSLGVTLHPVLNYLTGEWVPPNCPAVLDVRFSTDGFKPYTIKPTKPLGNW